MPEKTEDEIKKEKDIKEAEAKKKKEDDAKNKGKIDRKTPRASMTHELKADSKYFLPKWNKLKKFSIRKNDRDFRVNDFIWFEENSGPKDSRRRVWVKIIYILDEPKYLNKGYIAIGFKLLNKVHLNRSV